MGYRASACRCLPRPHRQTPARSTAQTRTLSIRNGHIFKTEDVPPPCHRPPHQQVTQSTYRKGSKPPLPFCPWSQLSGDPRDGLQPCCLGESALWQSRAGTQSLFTLNPSRGSIHHYTVFSAGLSALVTWVAAALAASWPRRCLVLPQNKSGFKHSLP